MTFAFPDLTVTTWGVQHVDGRQVWKARAGKHWVLFLADRNEAPEVLHAIAKKELNRGPK